jgi:hypothetical protein
MMMTALSDKAASNPTIDQNLRRSAKEGKSTMKKRELINRYYEHAVNVLQELKTHLVMGCRPELAIAMAVASLQAFSMAANPPKQSYAGEREVIRIAQALQLAVAHYSLPGIIEAIGGDVADRLRDEFLMLLMKLQHN